MKLHFLGTGAADWDIAHPRADRDFRRFSSVLIDEILLIDPGPCLMEFSETYGYSHLYDNVRYIVNTHRHADHFCRKTVDMLCEKGAELIPFHAFEQKNAGDYRITALPANHGTAENPVHFIIESGAADSKRLFYGCDGAWLLYPTYQAILKAGAFDLMVFDATIGDIEGDYRIFEHNNLRMVEQMRQTLRSCGKRFMISHMARTLHTDHETLSARMAASAIETAYDDLTLIL